MLNYTKSKVSLYTTVLIQPRKRKTKRRTELSLSREEALHFTLLSFPPILSCEKKQKQREKVVTHFSDFQNDVLDLAGLLLSRESIGTISSSPKLRSKRNVMTFVFSVFVGSWTVVDDLLVAE